MENCKFSSLTIQKNVNVTSAKEIRKSYSTIPVFQKVLRLRLSDRRRKITSITTLVLSLGSQEESCHPQVRSETWYSYIQVTQFRLHSPFAKPRPPPQEVAAWRRRIQCEWSVGFIKHSPSSYYLNRVTKRRAKELRTDPKSSIETRIWHKGQYYLYVMISPFLYVFMLAVWDNKKIRSMNLPFLP